MLKTDELAYQFDLYKDKPEKVSYIDALNEEAWEIRKTNPRRTLEIALKAREFAGKIQYQPGLAYGYRNSGAAYSLLSQYQLAQVDLLKAYSLFRDLGITTALASTFQYVGNVYLGINNIPKAKQYYREALYYAEKHQNTRASAYIEGNLGVICQIEGKLDDAIEYTRHKLEVLKNSDDDMGTAEALGVLGSLYLEKGDNVTAESFILRSLWISHKIKYPKGIAENFICISKYYTSRNEFDKAVESLHQAMEAAEQMGEKRLLAEIYFNLSRTHEAAGKLEDALEAFKLYDNVKTSILSFDNEITFSAVQVKSELEQSEKEKARYRAENSELLNAYAIIESKNKNITDSIRYAKQIQEAILPPKALMDKLLVNYFVYYQPKDIVSGDFYYITEKKGKVYFAAIDCTGHGVPGAFMSIICNNALNQAIRETNNADSAEILSVTNYLLSTAIRQKYEESMVKDGMDISLCILDRAKNSLQFSGANQLLMMIRDGEVQEFKGDKQAIGNFVGEELKPFSSYQLSLKKGDLFYLFTDGYTDQFGGPEGGKIMRKRLRKIIIENHFRPLNEQRDELSSFFNQWKGQQEQIDDVLTIGFKI